MKTQYRFSHRGGNRYYWESVRRVGGADPRREQISCPVDWFWRRARSGQEAQRERTS